MKTTIFNAEGVTQTGRRILEREKEADPCLLPIEWP